MKQAESPILLRICVCGDVARRGLEERRSARNGGLNAELEALHYCCGVFDICRFAYLIEVNIHIQSGANNLARTIRYYAVRVYAELVLIKT
jgi:hypothetical protein